MRRRPSPRDGRSASSARPAISIQVGASARVAQNPAAGAGVVPPTKFSRPPFIDGPEIDSGVTVRPAGPSALRSAYDHRARPRRGAGAPARDRGGDPHPGRCRAQSARSAPGRRYSSGTARRATTPTYVSASKVGLSTPDSSPTSPLTLGWTGENPMTAVLWGSLELSVVRWDDELTHTATSAMPAQWMEAPTVSCCAAVMPDLLR